MDEVSPFMESSGASLGVIAAIVIIVLIIYVLYRYMRPSCKEDNFIEEQIEILKNRQARNLQIG